MLALAAAGLLGFLPASAAGDQEQYQGTTEGTRLGHDLEAAIARVQPFLDHYGYAAVFLAVLVEGFGLVAPGQTLLIAASLMAARGGLNLAWLLLWTCIAAVLGNSLGYLLGRRGGRPLLQKFRVNEKHLERLEGSFSRYGPGLILLARFLDGLRQLNGIVAGVLQMPWKTFSLYNIIGALLWTGFWGLGTFILDKEIAALHVPWRRLQPWALGMTLAAVLTALAYVLHSRMRPKN